ncbi:MAG TPA: hypothetical protein PKL15_06445 [Saprospiraceae bacterium]|nr:hypothetical protein [Saprospiraceae bacterium]
MKNIAFFALSLVVAVCQAQTAPEQWRADIEYLRTTLPARHPLFKTQPYAEQFQNSLNTLEQHLDGRSDLDIALEIQAILSAPGDAHTRLDLIPLLQKTIPIPLGLGWYSDGVYVSGTTKRFQAILGKKIVKINGMDTDKALEKVGRYVGLENKYCLHKDGINWFRFPAAFRQAGVSASDTLLLTYEVQPGKLQNMKVFPIDPSNKADMQPAQIQPKDPDLRWQPLQYLFFVNWLEAEKVVYVQYNRCASREMALASGDSLMAEQLPPFQPLADSIIFLMRQHPDAKLFFDLRFNNGGAAADGVNFAKRISELPDINTKDRLFVAVNLYTFSSAVQIATVFQNGTKATLIGDAPAEKPNHYGEVRSFTLPNSRLKVVHSTRFMQIMDGNPSALEPDKVIEPSFDDFRNGRDPVLNYVRKYPKN